MKTTALSTVTSRGVLKASRVLFGLIALLVTPLMAQYLFGPFARPEAWLLALVAAPVPALLLARQVVRDAKNDARAVARVILLGIVLGALTGAVAGIVWVTFMPPWMDHSLGVGALFGTIYGSLLGVGLGALFGLWTWRARAALARPSALAAQKLTIDAGVMLTAAATFASWRYSVDGAHAASVVAGVAGAFVVVAAIVRVLRLQKLYDSVLAPQSPVRVAPRAPAQATPALVWSSFHDHVMVQGGDPTNIEPAPFRENSPVVEVAAVPGDPAAVRHAFGRALAYGFVALGLIGVMEASVVVRACVQDGCPQSRDCGGCSH